MGIGASRRHAATALSRLAGATAIALVLALAPSDLAGSAAVAVAAEKEPMLLESDTLTYDNDSQVVTAAGNVRIEYDGKRLVARRVVYDRNSSRMMAFGEVELVDAHGNRTYADQIDVTDDLAEGFVNALRVETAEKTYFAAESAQRRAGNETTFNSGVYTACEPCKEHPEKPPVWRIKATKIIWKGKEKTIRFINPRIELFGLPIAYLPALEVPDPSVKRKSGFLFPNLRFNSTLGTGISVPYYWALSPTFDLTTTGSYFTRAGFLTEAEWRQRFNNGYYSITAAGAYQTNPGIFRAGTVDRAQTVRGMIGTKGRFSINPRWTFGWDVMAQSDKNFAHTYAINGFNSYYRKDEVYITGLSDRNYFDLRAYRFSVQESTTAPGANAEQPWVLPSFDYTRTGDRPIAGGELTLNVNAQNIYRSALATVPVSPLPGQPTPVPATDVNIPGVEGANGRFTTELQWRRSYVAPGGLVISPLLALRGDAIYANLSAATVAAISTATIAGVPVASDVRSAYFRYMATAGMEMRWPVLFSSASSTHVLEPVAQIFARPDAPFATTLGIPNEDAQSLVFDAATLFERDKFSGYDEIEGGVRANLGFRYSGSLANGWTAHGILGQSYHIAGINPYGAPDLVNVGAYSGLETARSDYVGLVGVASPGGTALSAGARLDETSLELRRLDVRAGASLGRVSVSSTYAYIQRQPLYGFATDRHQLTVGAAARVADNWRVFGSGTYDFVAGTLLKNAIGFTYDDECFTFTLTAAQSRNLTGTSTTNSIGFNVSLRTIGDFGQSSGGLGL